MVKFLGVIFVLLTTNIYADEVVFKTWSNELIRGDLNLKVLKIQTTFGPLETPIDKIKSVNVGYHVSEDLNKQITELIGGLGSTNAQIRDDATKKLMKLGNWSYKPVSEHKSKDVEVNKRIDLILQDIKKNLNEHEYLKDDFDTIFTDDFVIKGKLLHDNFPFRHKSFGVQQLAIHEIKEVRPVGESVASFQVDASKYELTKQWFNTNIKITSGQKITVRASGTVDLWPQTPGQYIVTPKGYSQNAINSSYPAGALILKVEERGKSQETFVVGENWSGASRFDGTIYLSIAGTAWGNQAVANNDNNIIGTYQVNISVE